jgi:hypothetical protein
VEHSRVYVAQTGGLESFIFLYLFSLNPLFYPNIENECSNVPLSLKALRRKGFARNICRNIARNMFHLPGTLEHLKISNVPGNVPGQIRTF